VLAAYDRWGEACLDRFIGMFAFVRWDAATGRVFAARDRFGVKPLYRARRADGALVLASEIKALHAAGIPAEADAVAWATYLGHGHYDHSARTFWRGVEAVPAGTTLSFAPGEAPVARRWYDLAAHVGEDFDSRPDAVVRAEVLALLEESVRLRFRADVPVGINLSGGLDSSTLLALALIYGLKLIVMPSGALPTQACCQRSKPLSVTPLSHWICVPRCSKLFGIAGIPFAFRPYWIWSRRRGSPTR